MKKILLLIIAVIGVAVLRAQVPYERIATPLPRLRQSRLTARGMKSPAGLQKLRKLFPRELKLYPRMP